MILTQEQIKERAVKHCPPLRHDYTGIIQTKMQNIYIKAYTDCQTEQQNDAMEFAEWLLSDKCTMPYNKTRCNEMGEYYTTAQLYELYQQDKNKKG